MGIKRRILLSEGSSTSAREVITALGLLDCEIEICDPNPYCIGRWSRFVSRFHRCPGLASDPLGYLNFIMSLLARRHFDVLIPIHEQGLLFAKVREQLGQRVALAVPSFQSYLKALNKAEFSRILSELDLPQPSTAFVSTIEDLRVLDRFPLVVKTPIGTASRGVWMISNSAELKRLVTELTSTAFDELVVQQFEVGPIEHAQAVFNSGRLVAMHAYRQIRRGAGGGPAVKVSVRRPTVRSHMQRIGQRLDWHGALSLDYILNETSGIPRYIDCNPRLVEPINALLSGLDLTDLLLRVSLGEDPPEAPEDREGVHTHLGIQALMGCSVRESSRAALMAESLRLVTHSGIYAGSREELTPVRWDWLSAVPTIFAAVLLLANPKAALNLPKAYWGAHLLTRESIEAIQNIE